MRLCLLFWLAQQLAIYRFTGFWQADCMKSKISGGLVHELPTDLIDALTETTEVTNLWEELTPIARNEFICWVEDAKQDKTRTRRIKRTVEELLEGQKRPCCWAGCIHRTDKKPSKWQQAVLIDKKSKN
tara:strand:- start:6264 stop:6650 length:387 start_codon:yes stop_codon:yes gene_type:complete